MVVTNSVDSIDTIDFREGATLLINKELNWTSFDVVAKIRALMSKRYGTKKMKVGHGGTLDPLAEGLVVIGIGKHTKSLQTYQDDGKEYIAEIKFGATTLSYDRETEENEHFSIDLVGEETIEQVLKEFFFGTFEQTPPIFSAKSVDGKRAYEMARNGEHVELKPVSVTISDIELLNFTSPFATVRVECSKGTYIRSLAHDIGKALGTGAYLTKLTRTKSGKFLLSDALTVSEFQNALLNN